MDDKKVTHDEVVEELMQSKEAETIMKVGFMMYGYEDEMKKITDKGDNQ